MARGQGLRSAIMRQAIEFLRGGRPVRLEHPTPTLTLLDYLRLVEGATGTKEGCAEGDCGACTVVLRRVVGKQWVYQPVNACIMLAGQADGCEIITVEDLADRGELHPVQRALVEHHGSQCGFCTPGFVMALFALFHSRRGSRLNRAMVNDAIAGNLCRCTGYRPIIDAALSACARSDPDSYARQDALGIPTKTDDQADLRVGTAQRFFAAPASVPSLAALYREHPDAVLVAGATDVGLWVTKQLRELPKIIWLGRVRDLSEIEETDGWVRFGATVSHELARQYLGAIDADLGELMRRFAGVQIRTIATIGGNIANGSPIADLPPALIALGSTLTLQADTQTRSLPLEDFFIAYGKQDRRPGEFVRAVSVPKLGPREHFRCYKVSKRFDQDISAVMGAFRLTLAGSQVEAARIAFGGMAPTPKRARRTEAALRGVALEDPSTWETAIAQLDGDFSPISDLRASARYRRQVARNLLRKALIEIAGTPSDRTRVVGLRESSDAAC
jgi:xanthine dehydrogenase small subunit